MHVDIIQVLRCPVAHEHSALVASATRQVERRIVEGSLGCPVCGAEYPIRSGVADLRHERTTREEIGALAALPHEESIVRLAAQLDLTEPGRLVLLAGDYSAAAAQLIVMFDPLVLVVGIPLARESHLAEHASVMRIETTLPLARSVLHGAAIDATHVSRLGLQQVSALLKPRARLVAPAGALQPPDMSELARDELEWVAARTADSSGVVPLRRASR